MIRELSCSDFDSTLKVINDAAQAYEGVIPDDRWIEPYMSTSELKKEIEDCVRFYGWVENDTLLGVMGDPICQRYHLNQAFLCTYRISKKRDRRKVVESSFELS